jgi:hypothetical protein
MKNIILRHNIERRKMFKEYLKFIRKGMKDGFILLCILIFPLLPFILFFTNGNYLLSIVCLILGTLISATFGAFYFAEYKYKK